jgi:hypothetical protein
MVNSALWAPSPATQRDPVRRLANLAISLVCKVLLGAGTHWVFQFRSWTTSQTAEGLLPSAPLQF